MEYSIKAIDTSKQTLEKVAALLKECFPKEPKFTYDFLHWQYVLNPVGKVHGFNAFWGDELAAHYATIPVEYTINGQLRKGLLSLNTATGLNHRGKKLFKSLAEKTYETALEHGYDFVIGVANANSTHGFVNKMDFQLVAPLDVKVGIGFMSGQKNQAKVSAYHSEQWYTWRSSNPSHTYSKTKTGTYSKSIMPGLRALLTQDFTNKKALYFGATLWIGLMPEQKAKGLMLSFPDKLKPSPLNLIFRDLKGDIGHIAKEKVHFELFDFDAY